MVTPMMTDKKILHIITSLDAPPALAAPSLVLIEDENMSDDLSMRMMDMFQGAGFTTVREVNDALRALEQGVKKFVYFEHGQKLAGPIETLMTEYTTGMLSTSGGGSGIDVITFNPHETTCVIVMTRSQIEASYPKLFEYVGAIETL